MDQDAARQLIAGIIWVAFTFTGIIGIGNMGSSIAEKLKDKYEIFVFDKDKARLESLKGINIAEGFKDLLNRVNIVILAVKPK